MDLRGGGGVQERRRRRRNYIRRQNRVIGGKREERINRVGLVKLEAQVGQLRGPVQPTVQSAEIGPNKSTKKLQ